MLVAVVVVFADPSHVEEVFFVIQSMYVIRSSDMSSHVDLLISVNAVANSMTSRYQLYFPIQSSIT